MGKGIKLYQGKGGRLCMVVTFQRSCWLRLCEMCAFDTEHILQRILPCPLDVVHPVIQSPDYRCQDAVHMRD